MSGVERFRDPGHLASQGLVVFACCSETLCSLGAERL